MCSHLGKTNSFRWPSLHKPGDSLVCSFPCTASFNFFFLCLNSVCLSAHPSTRPPIHPSGHLAAFLSSFLPSYLSIYLSFFLSQARLSPHDLFPAVWWMDRSPSYNRTKPSPASPAWRQECKSRNLRWDFVRSSEVIPATPVHTDLSRGDSLASRYPVRV